MSPDTPALRYLLVGGAPSGKASLHPGGQITATRGLMNYAAEHGIRLEVVDTSQEVFPMPPLHTRLGRAVLRMLRVAGLLLRGRYRGAIIFASSGLSFYEKALMCLVCRLAGTPSILFLRSGHFWGGRRGPLKRRLDRLLLRLPTGVAAQGREYARSLREELDVPPGRLHIVPNWLPGDFPVAATPKPAPAGPLCFLYVGWLVQAKGLLTLMAAIQSSPMLQACGFRLAGDGTLRPQLEALIAGDPRLRNVRLLGWLKRPEIVRQMDECDVLVFPSLAEGFPNVVLEAMARAMPVAATRVGAVDECVVPWVNGFLYDAGKVEELTAALETLCKQPGLVPSLSKGALQTVQTKYGYQYNCARVFSLFDALARGSASASGGAPGSSV